jgi:hypothetical protein
MKCPTAAPITTQHPDSVLQASADTTPACPSGGFQIYNDPAANCPATFNDALTARECTAEQEGVSCNWGTESWYVFFSKKELALCDM